MGMVGHIHASSGPSQNWESIDWFQVEKKVKALQMRIAKAIQEKKHRRAHSLQWLLTHSFHAKLLAVKRVTTNRGKDTPGIDGVVWNTPVQKRQAVRLLKRRGYRPLPLRRVYIQKKNGKLRPLGIPTIKDRAMQALHMLALVPVAETTADPNSYGFRENRGTADAIEQCFVSLAKRVSPRWVLEGDIRSCFDEIKHDWMLHHIPTDKKILRSWLEAGYIDKNRLYPTPAGTPQGGVASPVLANMTLDGLEKAARGAAPLGSMVNVIRYADDFIVTGKSKEILSDKVMPAIRSFLKERGLTLSAEKTKITRIEKGFDFLGQKLGKHGEKLIIAPSPRSIKAILVKTKGIVKAYRGGTAWNMVNKLNPVIRGWARYHHHVCSKRIFAHVDSRLFKNIWNWAEQSHKAKGNRWIRKRYFRTVGTHGWSFFGTYKPKKGGVQIVDLQRASTVKIVRHIKVRAEANPYDPDWREYFYRRSCRKQKALGMPKKHPVGSSVTNKNSRVSSLQRMA